MAFRPAQRKNAKLRLALSGPSGSGKTFTAIAIAKLLGGRTALMDSERSSAEKYARKAGTDEAPGNWDFDHDNLEEKNPQEYLVKIAEAGAARYDNLLIDSYSHSWIEALAMIDKMGGWVKGGKNVSPLVARVVDAILSYPGHVVATFRAKAENVIEKDERTGKNVIKKLGMAPIARDQTDFEFDLWLDLERDGTLTVGKSRFHGVVKVGDVYTREELPKLVAHVLTCLDAGAPLTAVEEFTQKIRFAGSQEALTKVVGEVQAAVAAGGLTKDEVALLRPAFVAKKRELEGVSE